MTPQLVLFALAAAGLSPDPIERALVVAPPSLSWLAERADALGDARPSVLDAAPSWEEPATWASWSETLGALGLEREAEPAASRAHAALAELARAQERFDDAWRHLARARALPDDALAAHVARLLPGTSLAVGPFGPFPDGARFAPAPPPPLDGTPLERLVRREARIEGLVVGEATLALRVVLEPEGVQVDVEHRGGGAVRVRVAPPVPPELEPLALLVDWEERDDLPHEVELALSAEDARHTLWLRCRPRAPIGPTTLPERVPAALDAGGIVLSARPGAPLGTIPLDAVALALGQRTRLACRALAEPTGAAPPAAEPAGLAVSLAPGAQGRRTLARLVHLVEAWVLDERP